MSANLWFPRSDLLCTVLYWSTSGCSWSDTSDLQTNSNVSLLWKRNTLLVEQKQKLQGFFCLNLIVVQEEKTWEEALEHCRENHDDLTSLLSETENRLARREIQNSTVTQRVWVGLRFLGDTWRWVNGDPLKFQAWNQTGDPDQQSPVQKRCGALSKQGEWENQDCQEKLNFICV
uniref:C-type lectin domain-containing protein n=1 Tax=Oryzias latipes TaxID=8090 RepID=A0A3P9IBD1_ORYLA